MTQVFQNERKPKQKEQKGSPCGRKWQNNAFWPKFGCFAPLAKKVSNIQNRAKCGPVKAHAIETFALIRIETIHNANWEK